MLRNFCNPLRVAFLRDPMSLLGCVKTACLSIFWAFYRAMLLTCLCLVSYTSSYVSESVINFATDFGESVEGFERWNLNDFYRYNEGVTSLCTIYLRFHVLTSRPLFMRHCCTSVICWLTQALITSIVLIILLSPSDVINFNCFWVRLEALLAGETPVKCFGFNWPVNFDFRGSDERSTNRVNLGDVFKN
jgi:hypothetical protein